MSKIGTALVTGPTSGIGYELSKLLAQDGFDLVLVARGRDRLQEVAGELTSKYGIQASVIEKDLASPTAPAEIFAACQQPITVLVNNAGFGTFGEFRDTSLEDEMSLLAVNVVALTHLTKLFLRQAPPRGERRILNLASTAAFQPGPLMAVYYASKAYVLSFSEALANELSGSGVTVTVLCPGPVATGFQKRGNMEDSRLVKGRSITDARSVAEIGYRAMRAGKTLSIPSWWYALLTFSVRLAPRSLVPRIVRAMQEKAH